MRFSTLITRAMELSLQVKSCLKPALRLVGLVAGIVLVIPGVVSAQTFQWTNTSGLNSFWQIGNNWNPAGPPQVNDIALFDQNATYKVFFDSTTPLVSPVVDSVDVLGGTVTWQNVNNTPIQHRINGFLTVANGATLTTRGLELVTPGSVLVSSGGILEVDGQHPAGTSLSAAGPVIVTEGKMRFQNGGRGSFTGGLNSGLRINVNNPGTAQVDILTGSQIDTNRVLIGTGTVQSSTSSGTLNVNGTGSRISGSRVEIGNEDGLGSHEINVTAGALFESTAVNPVRINRSGSMLVRDATFDVNGNFINNGSVQVRNGGLFESRDATLGSDSTQSGTALVTGAASRWTTIRDLRVGENGMGEVDIEAGAELTADTVLMGQQAGSTGLINVSGNGSRLNITNELFVGFRGDAGLQIEDGGQMSTLGAKVDSSSIAQVKVVGADSQWTTQSLLVGVFEDGSATIRSGASLVSNVTSLGEFAGANGSIVIKDTGTNWTNFGGSMTIGNNGNGFITVTDGATVSTVSVNIGNGATGAGGLLVRNSGSSFNSHNLQVGVNGVASMIIEDEGAVSNIGLLTIGAQGSIDLRSGILEFGRTTIGEFSRINATGGAMAGRVSITGVNDLASLSVFQNPAVNLSGVQVQNEGLLHGSTILSTALRNQASGELRTLSGQWARFEGTGNINAGEINNFGGQVDFAQGMTNTSSGFTGGRGQFVADGGWTNKGVMAFNGTTDILGDVVNEAGGQIVTSGNATTTFFDDVVHNGSEIRTSAGSNTVIFGAATGAGSYTGTGTVFFEGDLRPGNSPNSVLFEGDVVLGSGARSIFELGGLGSGLFDQLLVAGDLNLDGALSVELIDGFLLGANQEFLIGDVGGSLFGQFDGLGEGSLVGSFGGRDLFITYGAGNGNDIGLFTAVPEPSSFALLGIAGVLGLAGRRRRNQTATSNRNKQKLPARFVGVSMVVAAGVLLGASNSAIGQTSIWNGGTGNWTDTAMWTGGSPGPTSDVFIDNGNAINSDVTFNTAATINSLTLDSGDQLQISAGRLLSFQGAGSSLINNGLILYQGGSFNGIRILSDTTFSGNGTIRLTDSTSRINGSIPPAALINGAGHTIEGGGQIGSRTFFTNNGLVNANISGLNINISTEDGNFNNNGIVRASTGGQISMATSGIMNGGTYEAIGSGSQVVIQGGTVRNATLNGTAGGVVIHSASGNAAAFDNINNQGAFQFQTADFSGFLNNSGTMVFTNNSNANMRLASNLSANGGGTLSFVQGGSNISGNFHASIGDQTLTGKGTFSPTSMAMTSGTVLAPSNPTRTRGGPAEVGIFEFDTAGQLFTSGIEMQFDLAGTTVNGAAPNLLQVNTGLDADLISFGIDYDQINVFDSLKMQDNPLIDVSLIDGFTPQMGDFFDILTADDLQLVGNIDFSFPVLNELTFDHELLNLFDPRTGTNRDVIRLTWGATAVPEPNSAVLIAALGSFLLAFSRRRKYE